MAGVYRLRPGVSDWLISPGTFFLRFPVPTAFWLFNNHCFAYRNDVAWNIALPN